MIDILSNAVLSKLCAVAIAQVCREIFLKKAKKNPVFSMNLIKRKFNNGYFNGYFKFKFNQSNKCNFFLFTIKFFLLIRNIAI